MRTSVSPRHMPQTMWAHGVRARCQPGAPRSAGQGHAVRRVAEDKGAASLLLQAPPAGYAEKTFKRVAADRAHTQGAKNRVFAVRSFMASRIWKTRGTMSEAKVGSPFGDQQSPDEAWG